MTKLVFVRQGITGMCYYFLRVSNDKAITANNISAEVNFGILDCTGGKLLQGFEGFMSKIMLPAVKSQEVKIRLALLFSPLVCISLYSMFILYLCSQEFISLIVTAVILHYLAELGSGVRSQCIKNLRLPGNT